MELLNWVGRYFTTGKNKAYQIAGNMGGGIVSIHLLDLPLNPAKYAWVEVSLKWLVTIVMAMITGLVTKMGADLWSEHLKPKIKFLNNGKKSEESKRA